MSEISKLNGYDLKDKKSIRTYDNIASMISDTTLKEGQHIKTRGYYSINDGGCGEYLIIDDNTLSEDGGLIHELSNGLFAKLIINNIVNVKQFGAKGDGETDDTQAFINAIESFKNISIPYGTYVVDYIHFTDGCNIDGNLSTINTAISSTSLNKIESNCTIKNLTINSINSNREWNRIDLTDSQNVILDNCIFSGFRQQNAVSPNVWALYFKNSKNIRVTNCKFDNNNFEDIIIEYQCENLYFENLTSTNGVNIDIEPSQNYKLSNITFVNCFMDLFHTTDYYYTGNNTTNITCIDCIIKDFAYRGADLSLINCEVYKYESLNISNVIYGGPIKIINSASFGKNLFKDKYFDSISYNTNNSYWKISYASTGWSNMISRVSDNDGEFTVLNPNHLSANIYLDAPIQNVDPSKYYALRTTLKADLPANSNMASTYMLLQFFNSENTKILELTGSLNRYPLNNMTPVTDQIIFIKPPVGATTLKIQYRSGPGGSTQSVYLKSAGFYEIKKKEYGNANELEPIPERTNRVFYGDTIPNNTFINYNVGDMIIFNTPSTYIGAVCTVAGQPGTWKNFGSIES